MPQANQLLPISTQTTASAGSAVSQPVENNTNSGEGNRFSSLLKSEVAYQDTAKSSPGQSPQTGNTVSAEGQKLPQDGKPLPVSAGFYILNKGGLVAGLDLQANSQLAQAVQASQPGANNSVLPEILPEAGTETEAITENPLGDTTDNEAAEQNTGQNTVAENGTDETEILTGLESEQVVPVAETNIPTESAEDISSRSTLPEASVVGQQQAVENILKHSTATSAEDTGIETLPGNGREVSARLAALMQKQENTVSGNGQVTEDALEEDLDVNRLMQEINDGKKLLDTEQGKANTIRSVANAFGMHVSNESAQNLNNLSGFQAVSAQPAVQSNVASNVTQSPIIDMPLKQQGWDEAMGQRVIWQVNQKIQNVDIRLNPPHLGSLEVRIKMTEEGANVTFSSQHSAVRETVEAALPKLREMLEEQGINLANADVSEQSVAQQNYRGETGDDSDSSNMTGKQVADEEVVAETTVSVSDGMLDLFA